MRRGFTFTELIVVTGMLSLLVGLSSGVMLSWRNRADLGAAHETVATDVLSQQIRSMTGACNNSGDCGVFFAENYYVLFDGSAYDPIDPANFRVPLESNFRFSTINLPAFQLVFLKDSGEVAGFNSAQSSIALTEINSGTSVTFQWNKHGVDITP